MERECHIWWLEQGSMNQESRALLLAVEQKVIPWLEWAGLGTQTPLGFVPNYATDLAPGGWILLSFCLRFSSPNLK